MNRSRFAVRRPPFAKCATVAALALAATGLSAKTLVFCSEGSPENFYPAINTTGTSFDANSQIYSRIVDFERGGTTVVPGLAERWTISSDNLTYTFHWRSIANMTSSALKSRVGVKFLFECHFTPLRR